MVSAALSPGGGTLAVADADKAVSLWTIATGQITALTGAAGPIQAVAFSPDGRTLASSETGELDLAQLAAGAIITIRLWDLATGQAATTLTPHSGYVVEVAFSPDGRILASAGTDHTVRLWDPAAGQATGTLFGHTEFVTSMAFSPDRHTLATGGRDRTVRLWTLG